MQNKKKRVLFKNTVMLYILTFSGYFFSFITVPYQTRVLGPEIFGVLGFASACAIYVQLFLDFGFILSSTEDVAIHQKEPDELSRIMTSVLISKGILGLISFGVVTVLCNVVPRLHEDVWLYQLFFIYTFINALLPDFMYRGMEQMSAITYRTVAIRMFFTVSIFIFLRAPEQYYAVPALNGLGALAACIWAYYDVCKRFGIRFVKVSAGYVWQTLKRSSGFFLSRIASTVYSATNTVILGIIYPTGGKLGYYTSADKLIGTAKSAFTPIADSLYPYMVKNKDFKMLKRMMLILMPPIILGCAGVWLFAEPLCALLFGEEFREAGKYLRLLMPVVVICLPTYVFGFPVLSPLGLTKYANISVIAGAIFHVAMLAGLYFAGLLSITSICISICITESLILLIRIFVTVKKLKKDKGE